MPGAGAEPGVPSTSDPRAPVTAPLGSAPTPGPDPACGMIPGFETSRPVPVGFLLEKGDEWEGGFG